MQNTQKTSANLQRSFYAQRFFFHFFFSGITDFCRSFLIQCVLFETHWYTLKHFCDISSIISTGDTGYCGWFQALLRYGKHFHRSSAMRPAQLPDRWSPRLSQSASLQVMGFLLSAIHCKTLEMPFSGTPWCSNKDTRSTRLFSSRTFPGHG